MPKKITGGQIQSYAGPKRESFWDYGAILGDYSGGPVFKADDKILVAKICFGDTCYNAKLVKK